MKLIEESGIINFRDLGGYKTKDGRTIRNNCFFRCGPIPFSNIAKSYLSQYRNGIILDLRSEEEVRGVKDYVPNGWFYQNISAMSDEIFDDTNADLSSKVVDPEFDFLSFINILYRKIAFDNKAYRFMFEAIKLKRTPLLFHCTAGKDRTGVAAMLILLFLGCERETIINDYMYSGECLRESGDPFFEEMPDIVKREWIELALDSILNKYSSYDEYFEQEFNITKEEHDKLKDYYLE